MGSIASVRVQASQDFPATLDFCADEPCVLGQTFRRSAKFRFPFQFAGGHGDGRQR